MSPICSSLWFACGFIAELYGRCVGIGVGKNSLMRNFKGDEPLPVE